MGFMTNYRFKLKLIKSGVKENKCEKCGINSWNNKPLLCELHHIDGNNQNNDLNNLQILCPNCHAQTDFYRGKNKTKKRVKVVSDEILIECIQSSYTKREALLKAGLQGKGGNYVRIKNFIDRGFQLKIREPKPRPRNTVKRSYKTKINWPDKENLIIMLSNKSTHQVAKELGVSDNSVRKAVKRYNLNIKEISPWSKKHGS